MRWGAVILGTVGAIAVATIGKLSTSSLTVGAVFAILAAAGLAPLSPQRRGMILAAFGVVGAAGASWIGVASAGADPDWPRAPLLTACVIVTASALLFRAAHRTSTFARTLVGVGIASLVGWAVITGGVEATVVESADWQAFLVPVARVSLFATLLGATLTFLDPRGHGGAWTAAAAILIWGGAYAGVTIVLGLAPARGPASIAFGDPRWVALTALPIFAALAAGGLCQVWVLLAGLRRRPRT